MTVYICADSFHRGRSVNVLAKRKQKFSSTSANKTSNPSCLIRKFICVCAFWQNTIIICNKLVWNILADGTNTHTIWHHQPVHILWIASIWKITLYWHCFVYLEFNNWVPWFSLICILNILEPNIPHIK